MGAAVLMLVAQRAPRAAVLTSPSSTSCCSIPPPPKCSVSSFSFPVCFQFSPLFARLAECYRHKKHDGCGTGPPTLRN